MRELLARSPGLTIGRGLKLALALQALIAVFLIATDVESRLRFGGAGDEAAPADPVAPGDQVRRYDPTRQTPRFSRPGERPAVTLPADLPPRLEFTLETDPDLGTLALLNGRIDGGDAGRFEAWLSGLAEVPDAVALNSPGGLVGEALILGRVLREAGLDTVILPGTACLSSCPYILAAGVERLVSRAGAVGLHQHYYDTPGYMPVFLAVEDIQSSQGETMAYLIEMGVDPGVMVYGLTTPPDAIYVLVEGELLESRMATEMTD